MDNGLKVKSSWDNCCPVGVSYAEHVQSLPLIMIQTYFSSGSKGVFLTNPMTVSMLIAMMPSYLGREFKWDGPTAKSASAGRIGGIQIWVNMVVPANEILIVDEPDSLQPHAKLELVNFVESLGPLDRLAQI